jgi:hypothetical protein
MACLVPSLLEQAAKTGREIRSGMLYRVASRGIE